MIDGKRALFAMEGSWRASATMYDKETRSVWLQLSGACVAGKRKGRRLNPLPGVVHTTWQRWRSLHPATTVLDERPDQLPEGHRYMTRETVRSGNPYLPPELRPHLRLQDKRLAAMDLLLGLELEKSTAAFPLVRLHLHPVVETELDDVPLTVWYDAASQTAVAFDRRVAGDAKGQPGPQKLTFALSAPGRFTDRQSGSTWTMDGRCVDGAYQGTRLKPLRSVLVEWYAWAATHPGTRVWSAAGW